MSIIIFGDNFSFPEGNAATNRVYTYAKGFIENNVNTHVICFSNNYLVNGNGISDGIQYYHPINQVKRNNSFLKRNWFKLLKYTNTIKLIRRINKEENIDAIIIYTQNSLTHLFSYYLAKKIKAKLIIENSEHPLRHYQTGFRKIIIGNLKLKIQLKTFDGILLITQHLIDFYKSKLHNDNKLLLVPSTIDPGRFTQTEEKPIPYSYIGYFGGLTFKRDNIDILIMAFAMITSKHPDLHLVMGGFCSEKEKKQIENLILKYKISLKVVLLKYLTRQEIIRYIIHSDILVMVRDNDMESQASFPCKLTEYLATSKPVVTVNVGEISDYLTDGVNSFLVEPGDCNGLAEKLDYVLNNYELALEIAQRGKQLTSTIFNYNFQAKRIIQFIETL